MPDDELEDVSFLENLEEKQKQQDSKKIERPKDSEFECEGCGS